MRQKFQTSSSSQSLVPEKTAERLTEKLAEKLRVCRSLARIVNTWRVLLVSDLLKIGRRRQKTNFAKWKSDLPRKLLRHDAE